MTMNEREFKDAVGTREKILFRFLDGGCKVKPALALLARHRTKAGGATESSKTGDCDGRPEIMKGCLSRIRSPVSGSIPPVPPAPCPPPPAPRPRPSPSSFIPLVAVPPSQSIARSFRQISPVAALCSRHDSKRVLLLSARIHVGGALQHFIWIDLAASPEEYKGPGPSVPLRGHGEERTACSFFVPASLYPREFSRPSIADYHPCASSCMKVPSPLDRLHVKRNEIRLRQWLPPECRARSRLLWDSIAKGQCHRSRVFLVIRAWLILHM